MDDNVMPDVDVYPPQDGHHVYPINDLRDHVLDPEGTC